MQFSRLMIIAMMGAAVLAGPAQAQTAGGLKETPEGLVTPDGRLIGKARLVHNYVIHQPAPASAGKASDRAKNRATVRKYFELPPGEERARLSADDGVKEVLSRGMQWVGIDALVQSNRDSAAMFPSWKWSNTTVWDTQDPAVFWVEADGSTDPASGKEVVSGHYLAQVVLKAGKIVLYREFDAPVKVTKAVAAQ